VEIKVILSLIAICIGILAYIPYLKDILAGKTKPHIFSWFGWMIMEFIAFFAIIAGKGSAGAWPHLLSALVCLGTVILCIKHGEKNITKLDTICIILSMVAVTLWQITNNPVWAVFFITIADALAYTPTFRKAYYKPHQETLITFALNIPKQILILLALSTYSLTTLMFDVYLITANTVFVSMLIIRRRQLKDKK